MSTFLPLSASEMAAIWQQCMNDKAVSCTLLHFLRHVDDQEIEQSLKATQHIIERNLDVLSALFLKENMPIPLGFNEEDLHVDAPRLFSDSFYLLYLKHVSNLLLLSATYGVDIAKREDIRTFFRKLLLLAEQLNQQVTDLLLAKKVYIQLPPIPIADSSDMAGKEMFLGHFFDEKRPLTVIEISHLISNIETNLIAKDLLLGFAQTATSEDIKAFLLKGHHIMQAHIEQLSEPLMVENIPIIMEWDYGVEKSAVPPFSEKLMMFHVSAMVSESVRNYGMSMATNPRLDLSAKYTKFTNEILQFAEETSRISIEQGWLEEPPHIPFPKIHLEP
ncbi:DUF3231 family protein [Priestia flexa]|uniref:DUF3231 family protein n=1 Tax=Priestia flexa TaxID=86664 RepID=UPI003D2EBD43